MSRRHGVEDYFKDLNARAGGRVKVKFVGVDTRYDVARESRPTSVPTEHKLLIVNAIGPHRESGGPLATKDKLVQIVPGDGEFQANWEEFLSGSGLPGCLFCVHGLGHQ